MFHTQGFYFLFICVSSLCFFGGGGVAMLPSSCSEEVNNVRHTLNNISLKSCFSVPATNFTDCSVQLSSCVITDIPIGLRKECQIIFSIFLWFNHQRTGRFNTVPEVYMYFIKCICCWKEIVLSLNTLDEMLCPWQSTEKCFLWCFPIMSDSQALQKSCYTVHKALKCLKFGYR